MPTFTTAKPADLQGIINLQAANLPVAISAKEAKDQGFVTVQHDLAILTQMNTPYPHIIAKDADQVVGYTLVMERRFGAKIPVLVPMFELINTLHFEGQSLAESTYFVMGQVCVAKNHRGQGVFAGLYQLLAQQMNAHFDYCITEIAKRNTRSITAHAKVGFQNIHEYTAPNGEIWVIVLLDLSKK